MFKYRSQKREEYLETVMDLYFNRRMSMLAISKKLPLNYCTISKWISIFAEETGIEMTQKKYKKHIEAKEVKETGKASVNGGEKDLLAEIRRLEGELRREKLRADLNEEIINVAEQKFNIQIRKKAGAKR